MTGKKKSVDKGQCSQRETEVARADKKRQDRTSQSSGYKLSQVISFCAARNTRVVIVTLSCDVCEVNVNSSVIFNAQSKASLPNVKYTDSHAKNTSFRPQIIHVSVAIIQGN